MRCTPPMNAPWPPPTMPRRMRRGAVSVLAPSMAMAPSSADAKHLLVRGGVHAAAGKVVERALGHADDVIGDERRTFTRAVFRVLDAALPFKHGPTGVVVGRHLRKDRGEIDLPVTERAEPARTLEPRLETAVHALLAGRIELGILHVEDLDAVVVVVDVVQVVQLLQDEVARVVEQAGALVVADAIEKHLVGFAVVQVLARVDLVADVHTGTVECVEDRAPT